ncbi:putative RNA-directed DNA polymerase [Helianthus annuus]|nr:putative RNA-directed DNA polymerase [Helianthus annuus]
MPGENNSGDDLSLQLANLLKNSQPKSPKLSDSLQINLKLNGQNYALWTRMIRVAIGGRSKNLLKHLTSNPPDQKHETYEQWEQDDLVVFSWLIQNIEPVLAGNLTEFPTAKSLWDALVVTYSSGRDKLQTFNLHVKANEVKQNNLSLEELWIILQGVWGEIDRIDPNPMTCPTDIQAYSKIRSEQKLFQFLNALDRKYDPIKREILRLEPLPTSEAAYATVRKEAAHQNILGTPLNDTQGIAAGLIATETEGLGLVSKGYRRSDGKKIGSGNKDDKSHLKCDHCGMMKHTKDQCFRLVGYPEWWSDGHKKGTKTTSQEKGKTSNTTGNREGTGEGSRNSSGFGGMAAAAASMNTEEEDDFFISTGIGDIRTGRIIGRGTERQGLYYVDEVTQSGTVTLAHGTVEREAWLWHRRLGHPSTGYLHILFPKIFPSNSKSPCETCVLAKSHRQTFKPNNTRVDVPFSLIHSDVWGPAPIIGGQNFRFFVLFVDDCTRMTWVYFLKNKSEVIDKFIIFHTMIQTQFQTNIQIFRSDNGGNL